MLLRIFIPAFALIVGGGYLMWPLRSDDFKIEWSQEMLDGKNDYVTSKVDTTGNRPNVLVIMVDDLGVADATLTNKEAPVHTPFLDALADRGVRFTNAYVSHSVCSPSRAAILTGRYPQRFGFEHQMHDRYLRNRLEYYGFKYFIESDPWIPRLPEGVPRQQDIERQGLPPSELTIPEILKTRGYATGLVGKWHLGEEEINEPCAFGFDEFYGFTASHSLYSPEGTPGIVDQKIPGDWTDDYIWSGQRNGAHAIYHDCNEIQEPDYLTFRIAEESIDFMERHADEPFFLMTSFNAPHTPLQAPIEYAEKFAHIEDPVKQVHYAMVAALDDAIGRLSEFMITSGLDSNTLVFFISDNGGAEYNMTTENGDYKGGKITDFEGGLKVPMFMLLPGTVQSNTLYTHPVIAMDIAATIFASTGTKLPSDREYDGVDLAECVLRDRVAHEFLFWRKGYNGAVRNDHWKLSWDAQRGDTLLFDLKSDPAENRNLYTGANELVKDLSVKFDVWSSEMADPLWPALIDYYCEIDGKRYWFDN